MHLPDYSGFSSRLARLPLGSLAVVGIAVALGWAYGRYQQKPVAPPPHPAVELPGVRPRDPGKYVRVLSIDGGGMRGLLALYCLDYLEKKSGRPVSELFDVMVGTSSGAFIVAALSVPLDRSTPRFTAAELIKEFPKVWSKTMETPVFHPLLSLEGRTAPKYLTRVRQSVFQEFFGAAQVADALTTTILPTYSIQSRAPFLFASDMGKSTTFSGTSGRAITEAGDYFLADAVTAATCNPAVASPSKIPNTTGDQSELLIGAEIYANNPSLLALNEALLRFPGKQCVLISLGAGMESVAPEKNVVGWNVAGSPEEIVRFAAEASQLTNAQIVSSFHRFGSGPVAASIRLDPPLPADVLPQEDCSEKNVKDLTALATKLTSEKSATLDRTADFLGAR